MFKSKALEVNLAHTQVEVEIDPRYECLQEVMSDYYGLLERLSLFLTEVSHPYKNWQFIVDNARGFALDYFHLFKSHPKGPEAVERLIGLFCNALEADTNPSVKVDATDNLILYIEHIITGSENAFDRFYPIVVNTFQFINHLPKDDFKRFVRSYYGLKRLGQHLYNFPNQDQGKTSKGETDEIPAQIDADAGKQSLVQV